MAKRVWEEVIQLGQGMTMTTLRIPLLRISVSMTCLVLVKKLLSCLQCILPYLLYELWQSCFRAQSDALCARFNA